MPDALTVLDEREYGVTGAGSGPSAPRATQVTRTDFFVEPRTPGMDSSLSLRRRHLLAGSAAVTLGVLAGCVGDSNGGDNTGADNSGAGDDSGADDDSDEENDTDGADDRNGSEGLNLQEANVVDVAFEERAGEYPFDVTLHHDDDGEDGYANWWQVERLDGTRLGRRELHHAHSRQPFTRSETVAVPDGVDCVVVRGHDQTHGYGGQAVLVNLGSGETRALDQGPERESFDESDCPDSDSAA